MQKKHTTSLKLMLVAAVLLSALLLLVTTLMRDGTNANSQIAHSTPLRNSGTQVETISNESSEKSKLQSTVQNKKELSFKDIFRRSIKNSIFALPTNEEVKAFESLLDRSIATSFETSELHSAWSDLGWQVQILPAADFVVIEEASGHRRGRGLYVLRMNTTVKIEPIMIQAPHRFFDTNTGVITRKLFEDHPVQAAAWNTVHRKEYDMAHRSRSFFNAFTRSVLKNYPTVVNFQIHGFSSSKRKGDKAESPNTLAIVSNATRSPDRMTKDFARQMKSSFGKDRVWLFPLETTELGATKNEQASVMRRQGSGSFLHVEMTKPFRERLVNSAIDRRNLYRAFTTVISNDGSLVKTGGRVDPEVHSN